MRYGSTLLRCAPSVNEPIAVSKGRSQRDVGGLLERAIRDPRHGSGGALPSGRRPDRGRPPRRQHGADHADAKPAPGSGSTTRRRSLEPRRGHGRGVLRVHSEEHIERMQAVSAGGRRRRGRRLHADGRASYEPRAPERRLGADRARAVLSGETRPRTRCSAGPGTTPGVTRATASASSTTAPSPPEPRRPSSASSASRSWTSTPTTATAPRRSSPPTRAFSRFRSTRTGASRSRPGGVEAVGEGEGGDERERQPSGGYGRSRATSTRSTPIVLPVLRSTSARAAPRRLRRRREPLRSARAAGRHRGRLRWIAERLLAVADELCRRAAGVGTGGRLQPRLRTASAGSPSSRRSAAPRIHAGSVRGLHRRPAVLPRACALAVEAQRGDAEAPGVLWVTSEVTSDTARCPRAEREALLPPGRLRAAGLGWSELAVASDRVFSIERMWRLGRRGRPVASPARIAARIRSCSARERASRPGRRSDVLAIRSRTLRSSTEGFLHAPVSARLGDDVRELGQGRGAHAPRRRPGAPGGTFSIVRSRLSRTSGGRRSREVAGDVALEQDSKLEDLADVCLGRLEHPSAPVRLDLDQAVALEPDQCLADRRLRHAEVGRRCGPRRAARRWSAPRRGSRRAAARRRGAPAGQGGSSRGACHR